MASRPVAEEDKAPIYKKLTFEYDGFVLVQVSSNLKGTYQTALKVHHDLASSHTCQVAILDSLPCSMGYGLPLIAAARTAQEGRCVEDIVAQVRTILQKMSAFFALPELKYLRGGRKSAGSHGWSAWP
jgi:fatty acid-binding protein DegV